MNFRSLSVVGVAAAVVFAPWPSAAEMGAGTENRQWLPAGQGPASLLPALPPAGHAVVELKEAASNLAYDPVTRIWGFPVPRLGDPDYAPNNLNYTGVVRDAPLVLPARIYVPDGKLDRTLPCILTTDGYGVGDPMAPTAAAGPAAAPPGGEGGEGGGGQMAAFVAQGYVGIRAGLRQGSSEPQSRQIGINTYTTHYGEDGVAIINEAVRRFGCGMVDNNPETAKVGMIGGSLLGGSQWAVITRNDYPAALKAIAPDSPGINHKTYSTLWYPGGMLPGIQRITRPGTEFGNNYPLHRDFDEFWKNITVSTPQLRAAASRRLALLLTAGWYEYNSPGNIDSYIDFNALAGPSNKRLVISPTGHTMPEALYRPLALYWMNKWLKGEPDKSEQPQVLIFVRGTDRWRAEKAWPIPDTKYLSLGLSPRKSGSIASRNDGSLIAGSGGVAGALPAKYDYDLFSGPFLHVAVGQPSAAGGPPGGARGAGAGRGAGPGPGPGAGPGGPNGNTGSNDLKSFLNNGNMATDERNLVTWSTPVLDKATEVTGNAVVRFWAASTTDDADFVAALTDVAPDGTSSLIIQGYLNGPREAYTKPDAAIAPPVPLVPGVARQFTLRLNATSYVVAAGHRLRLTMAGGSDLRPMADGSTPSRGQGPGKNGAAFQVSILQTPEKNASLELPVIGTPPAALTAGTRVPSQ